MDRFWKWFSIWTGGLCCATAMWAINDENWVMVAILGFFGIYNSISGIIDLKDK